MGTTSNRNLQILEEAEIDDIYALPNFGTEDREVFFTLSFQEHLAMKKLRGISSRIYFILQLGYFKAKHLFFVFDLERRAADTEFALKKYFPKTRRKDLAIITKPTRLDQRRSICLLLEYRFFEESLHPQVERQSVQFAKRYNHAVFLFRSLYQYFHKRKIILPSYSFLQRYIIGPAIRNEHQRLERIIDEQMSDADKALLDSLLEKPENGMYPFTMLQKEPSSLKYYQIRGQLKHSEILRPIYKMAFRICQQMGISGENIKYYGTLAVEQKIFNLKRMKGNIRYVHLLCFAYKRYRSINDILVEGLKHHVLGLEKQAEAYASEQIHFHRLQAHASLSKVPKVLALFKGNTRDKMLFEQVKKEAYDILDLKEMGLASDMIDRNRLDKKELRWRYYQINGRLISLYLRPLGSHFEFNNGTKCKGLIDALSFVKKNIASKKTLEKTPRQDFPCSFLPQKRKRYILNGEGVIEPYRYEMALYQTLRNKLESGDIFVPDSFKNRSFEADLIADGDWQNDRATIIKRVDLSKLKKSAREILEQWKDKIEPLYKKVNDRIEKGLNPSVQLDGKGKDGSTKWHLIHTGTSRPLNHRIYKQFTPIDIASLLQLVDDHTGFLSAFTHISASKVGRKTDKQKLIACIVAFGTNYGIGRMANISDMPYQDLMTTANTLVYLDTLREANRKIANITRTLAIYEHYNLQPGMVHSSSDGQKYYTRIPTINARYSPKYFGLDSGVSALTNVADNIPVSTEIIGANEHESHYVLDLLERNDTDIRSDIHSTDTHGTNQVNFAILDMFGYRFAPRYKDISSRTKVIYSFQNPSIYKGYLIKPIKKIDEQLIEDEWDTFQRIIASLAMKTTSQSTIIKKLSSYKRNNRTKRAIMEYDNIVSTYHKLYYIDTPSFQKQVNTSLNRGENINKLKKHFFHADGGKFKVHTVMEQKIWNECNRLLANATIYYNTWLLSELLIHHQMLDNPIEVDLIKKVSPIASQNIHVHGRYKFRINKVELDVKSMVKKIRL